MTNEQIIEGLVNARSKDFVMAMEAGIYGGNVKEFMETHKDQIAKLKIEWRKPCVEVCDET